MVKYNLFTLFFSYNIFVSSAKLNDFFSVAEMVFLIVVDYNILINYRGMLIMFSKTSTIINPKKRYSHF